MADTVAWHRRGPGVPDRPQGLVWLASYPKSGNTWFRAVLAALVRGPAAFDINALDHGHSELISASRLLFQRWTGLDPADLPLEAVYPLRARVHAQVNATAGAVRVMKVHDSWEPPAGRPRLFQDAAAIGTLYLVRNPLDVAVSLAAHLGISPSEAAARLCDPAMALGRSAPDGLSPMLPQHLGTWGSHVLGWLEAPLSRLLVLRYEDILAQPRRAFAEALRFAGFTFTDAEVAAAVEATRFSRLRRMEEERGFTERPAGMARFFRQGGSGGWREALAPADVRRILDHHGDLMRRLGYLDDRAASVDTGGT